MDLNIPELWAHQKETIDRAIKTNSFALFHSMGTGKTRTMLEILRHHYNLHRTIFNTLIVAPIIVTKKWGEEITKYTKIPKEKVHYLKGSIAQKAEQLKTKQGIVIVNYDVFIDYKFAKAAQDWKPGAIVLDESHRIKSTQSKRTKNILRLSSSLGPTCLRYLLTGSPITNTQLDLWSQFYFMDMGKTFGDSFYGFRNRYFINVNANRNTGGKYFPLWVPKKGIDVEINKLLMQNASVVKKEDCLDLPPLIREEVDVHLSKDQEEAYKMMKKEFIAFVKEKAATAPIALTKMLRLQQIISGFLKMEDGSIERFPNPREDVLSELLADLCTTNKVIVWSVFHEDYSTIRRVCERQKIPYKEAHGLVDDKQKLDNIYKFRHDQDVKVLIGSPQAIGIGIDLVEAKYAIWYSRNFSLEHDEQAMARNYRGGSEIHEHVTRYDLVARGTLDEIILKAVKDKKNLAESILNMNYDLL